MENAHPKLEGRAEPIYYPIRRSGYRSPMKPGGYTEIGTGSD
jgi:hypothetical protein